MMGREYHRDYSKQYYRKRIAVLISMLGGKCIACGCSKNLQFDHIDSSTKKFSIGKILSYTIKKQEEEIKKCQLLCQACHSKKTKNDSTYINRNIARGKRVKSSKLKDDDVVNIRKLRADGYTYCQLSEKFNVSKGTIYLVLKRKTWAHVK